MSVIINDFELVSDQEEAPAPTTNGEAPSQPPPPPIKPMDVVEIMRRRDGRRARLRAH